MHVFVYCLSYLIWSVWCRTGELFLPSDPGLSFAVATAIKGLVWLAPLLLLLKNGDGGWLIRPDKMLRGPFPWYATFIGVCMTTAVLHTAHIVLVGIDVWGIFDPLWIGLSLSAAVIEEIVFRGILFNRQTAFSNKLSAALISGLLFAVYHYPEFLAGRNLSALLGFRFWFIAVMGTVFSLVFAKWKHLGMTIVIHFVWNMLCFWFVLA